MQTIKISGVNASPSTLKTWMETPEVVRLQQIEGFYPRWRAGTWFGTCFHKINEMAEEGQWEDYAMKMWMDKKDEVRAKCRMTKDYKKAELECYTAGRMCRLYYEYHCGKATWHWQVQELRLDSEYPVVIDGVKYVIPLKGYIDGITRQGRGTGGDWIFDSKTRTQLKKSRSDVLLEHDLQMQFYRWVLGTVGYEKKGKRVRRKICGILYDQIRKPSLKSEGFTIADYLERVEKYVRKDMSSYFLRWQQSVSETNSEEWRDKYFDGLMHNYVRWVVGFYDRKNGRWVKKKDPFTNPFHHVGNLVGMYGPTDYYALITKGERKGFDKADRPEIRFEEVPGG